MKIRFNSAVLMVKDIDVSRRFYETVLRQEIEMDLGKNIAFKAGFSLWQADYAYPVIFGRPFDELEQRGYDQFEMCFESEIIDEVYSELKASGVEFVHEMVEQPWAQRVFRVYDPDRNVVEVGEPMEFVIKRLLSSGMTELEVAQRTYMPIEAVREVAARF
ncbi:MAG: glyoxalase [Clostridiaceae bacterium]|jgi:catechol 2,3-dioxygenase-like lactoylglutathione lyase family enzyme|nr:glyoxalase [Clostridiaceae bacterium]